MQTHAGADLTQYCSFKRNVGADLAALVCGTKRRQVIAYPLSEQHWGLTALAQAAERDPVRAYIKPATKRDQVRAYIEPREWWSSSE